MIGNKQVVLLLEDEPLIALDVEYELVGADFAVTLVASCEDAHAWLDGNLPDLAVVDIVLRDGKSSEVISRLIAARVPFIVHSGSQPDLHEQTPYAEGTWISKPSAENEISSVARSLLAVA